MYRPLLVAAVLLFATSPVVSAGDDLCKNIGDFAKGIMTARQAGMGMPLVMDLALQSGSKDQSVQRLFKKIVLAAYDEPIYPKASKEAASKQFSNHYLRICYSLRKKLRKPPAS